MPIAQRGSDGADDADRPSYDSARFAAWLRRYGEAEHLVWADVAAKAGIHYSTLMNVLRGTGQRPGQRMDPTGTTLARLSYALGLDLNYLASKAGLNPDGDASRYAALSEREREALLTGLMGLPETPLILRMCKELRTTLPNNNHQEDA